VRKKGSPKLTRFSKAIRSLREKSGKTQTQVAIEVGVSAPAVCDWETGHGRPDRKRLKPLAKALSVPVQRLADMYLDL
jgi:transcriptional regulator with XRE-family HTH domain